MSTSRPATGDLGPAKQSRPLDESPKTASGPLQQETEVEKGETLGQRTEEGKSGPWEVTPRVRETSGVKTPEEEQRVGADLRTEGGKLSPSDVLPGDPASVPEDSSRPGSGALPEAGGEGDMRKPRGGGAEEADGLPLELGKVDELPREADMGVGVPNTARTPAPQPTSADAGLEPGEPAAVALKEAGRASVVSDKRANEPAAEVRTPGEEL